MIKLRTRTNSETAAFYPRDRVGVYCPSQRPHCSVELKRQVAERGRRSLACGYIISTVCDALFKGTTNAKHLLRKKIFKYP